MNCEKCNGDLFKIQIIPCCDDCSENAAWDPDEGEYTDDEKVIHAKGLTREHVETEGECNFGYAYGAGCHMYICAACGQASHLPIIDGC